MGKIRNQHLDDYTTFITEDYNNSKFIYIKNLSADSDVLTYGKHLLFIGILDNKGAPYRLKLGTELKVEIVHQSGYVIDYEFINLNSNNDTVANGGTLLLDIKERLPHKRPHHLVGCPPDELDDPLDEDDVVVPPLDEPPDEDPPLLILYDGLVEVLFTGLYELLLLLGFILGVNLMLLLLLLLITGLPLLLITGLPLFVGLV